MKSLLSISILLVLLSCSSPKPKPLETYREEAKTLDKELCTLDETRDQLQALLSDSLRIKAMNPYFNLDSVKMELSKLDSVMNVKSKHLKEIEDTCQNVYKTYSI